MVAPFLGCTCGGICYDLACNTDPTTPVNTALKDLLHPKKAVKERIKEQKEQGLV